MRRSLVAVTSVALAVSLGSTAPASADQTTQITPSGEVQVGRPVAGDPGIDPVTALAVATRVKAGKAKKGDPSLTLALRDLSLVQGRLQGRASTEAARLTARPDLSGKRKKCNDKLCLHWSSNSSSANYATAAWAKKSFEQMKKVWKFETKKMDYRRPPKDFGEGGNRKFDVYLENLGSRGLYGYCSTERYADNTGRHATSYCVLDNNFSQAEFPTNTPLGNLKVTAAHEFFHAVQFAYNFRQASWLMESTATWMEERYADRVNDNRNYLPWSQLAVPTHPITKSKSPNHYGNWVYWEYFTQRKGNKTIKTLWKRAERKSGYKAMKQTLGGKKFRKNFAKYASVTTRPDIGWSEGSAGKYPVAKRTAVTLTEGSNTWSMARKLKRTTLAHAQVSPHGTLSARGWKLRIKLNMWKGKKGATALVRTVKTNGKSSTDYVKINRKGRGKSVSGFRAGKVATVIITIAHAGSGKAKTGKLMVKAFR